MTESPIPDGLIVQASPRSVDDTVDRLLKILQEKQVQLFAVIDHGGEASRHGLRLRDTKVVVFGSPLAGTPVMQAVPLVALDLPLKVLIFDDDGTTRVCHLAPAALAERYGLPPAPADRLSAIDAIVAATIAA